MTLDPLLRLRHPPSLEAKPVLPALDGALDQPGVLEDADVFADGGLGEPESPRRFAHRRRTLCQPFDDRPPCGVREGQEAAIELR
jgi:hypothetical protein